MPLTLSKPQRLELWLAVAVLAGAACQWRLPLPLGGLALPISTLVLLVAATIQALVCGVRKLPGYSGWLAATAALACLGLLGSPAAAFGTGMKELIQYLEILVLAPLLFVALVATGGRQLLTAAFVRLWGPLLAVGLVSPSLLALSQVKFVLLLIVATPFWLAASRSWPPLPRTALLGATGLVVGLNGNHGGLLLAWSTAPILAALAAAQRPPGSRRLATEMAPLLVALAAAFLLAGLGSPGQRRPWDALRYRYDDTHVRRVFIDLEAALRAPASLPLGGGPGNYRATINRLKLHADKTPHPQDQRVIEDGTPQLAVLLVEGGLLLVLACLGTFGIALARMLRQPPAPDAGANDRLPLFSALLGLLLASLFALTWSSGVGLLLGGLLGIALTNGRSEVFAPTGLVPVEAQMEGSARGKEIWADTPPQSPSFAPPGQARRGCTPSSWPRTWPAWPAALPLATAGLVAVVAWSASRGTGQGEVSPANQCLANWLRHLDRRTPAVHLPMVLVADPLADGQGGGNLLVEAAHYRSLTAPFVLQADPTAAGGSVLAIPEGAGKEIGEAVYLVDLPTTGVYVFHATVNWLDGCSNSLAVEAAGQTASITSDRYGRWHTLEAPRRLALERGPLELRFRNLEDGIKIATWGLRLETPGRPAPQHAAR